MRAWKLRVLIVALLMPSAQAAPFLVCDPYPAAGPLPDSFSVGLDSGALISVPARINGDGSRDLFYDLATLGISNGSHQFKVTAVSSLWGSSPQTNFTFVKAAPTAPSGLGIRAQ